MTFEVDVFDHSRHNLESTTVDLEAGMALIKEREWDEQNEKNETKRQTNRAQKNKPKGTKQ